jgi:hypothetical protein
MNLIELLVSVCTFLVFIFIYLKYEKDISNQLVEKNDSLIRKEMNELNLIKENLNKTLILKKENNHNKELSIHQLEKEYDYTKNTFNDKVSFVHLEYKEKLKNLENLKQKEMVLNEIDNIINQIAKKLSKDKDVNNFFNQQKNN